MPPVKGVSEGIPEMDPVTPEKEALIDALLDRLQKRYSSTTDSSLPPLWASRSQADRRILAYKYLTARKWSLDKAEEMAHHTTDWRVHQGVDTLRLFPSALPAIGYDMDDVLRLLPHCSRRQDESDFIGKAKRLIQPVYQSGFHFWDKQGHPVMILVFGKCNVKQLYKRYQQLCGIGEKATHVSTKYHIYENELGEHLARYLDAKNQARAPDDPQRLQRRILGITCIIDCGGLGYGHLWNPILDVVKCQFAVDAAHYPEGLHRVFVINCPAMIKFAYTIVKGALDPRVQQKITFCSAGEETTDTMRLIMDPSLLPRAYGGEWESGFQWGDIAEVPSDAEPSDAVTENIAVSAGKTLTKEYPLEAGDDVAWEFASTTGHDISFSVTFFPSSSTEASQSVVEMQKLRDGADRFTAPSAGRLLLLWDNKASWIRSKHLQMKIIKSSPCAEVVAEEIS